MRKLDLGQKSPGEKGFAEIIGIDLGTTNCAVATYNADTVPTLLPIGENGQYTIPSCVRWDATEMTDCQAWTVGAEAYRERFMPDVIYSVKRIMGTDEKVRFVDRRNPDHVLEQTPAEVSSIILRHLRLKVAEFYKPVDQCVITVPAYFNQRQIGDTLEAAKLAGWDCKQILKEPTSASYIYSQLGYAGNGSVLIYDLGGGTFDVTHMNFLRKDAIPKKLLTSLRRQYGIELESSDAVDNTNQYFCRVLGTYGDIHLGGDDIDQAMGDEIIDQYKLNLTSYQREELYLKCEGFKKLGVYGMDSEIAGKKIKLTMDMLNNAVDKIFSRTLDLMQDIDMSTITTIVLVGGSTKSPRLRENLAKAFPNAEISAVLDPDATVALGAGSVAKALSTNSNLMYSDVLPLPIGILVDQKKVEVCIQKNTSMPYSMNKTYYTMHNNQERITLHVYQGMSEDPSECTYLGRLTLNNIPKAPAGEVLVGVSFILTAQGRLRIRSHIEGESREEELVIDNIFDVARDSKSDGSAGVSEVYDDFEEIFMPFAEGNDDILELFRKRRNVLSSNLQEEDKKAKVREYEDLIAQSVM